MITVFLKSTRRPWASVRIPSSRICKSMLNTSGWAFSISSNSTDGIGFTPDFLRQLPAFVIAHIAGRRPDQTGDRVLFHVFRHVQPDHGVFVPEHSLCQGFAEFGLPNAGRTQENEGADRTTGILEPHPAAADGLGHGCNRFILPDDPLVQDLLHTEQPLAFGLSELYHGHPVQLDTISAISAADTSPVIPAFSPCQWPRCSSSFWASSFSSSRRWAARSKSCSLTAAFFSSDRRLTSSSSFFRSGGAVKAFSLTLEAASSTRSMALSGRYRSKYSGWTG